METENDENQLFAEPFEEQAELCKLVQQNNKLVDLFASERFARTQVFGIQLDEMWAFVDGKEHKQ